MKIALATVGTTGDVALRHHAHELAQAMRGEDGLAAALRLIGATSA